MQSQINVNQPNQEYNSPGGGIFPASTDWLCVDLGNDGYVTVEGINLRER